MPWPKRWAGLRPNQVSSRRCTFSVIAASLASLLVCLDVYPQTTPAEADLAILLRGPVDTRGIDFLGPNTIPGLLAIYRMTDSKIEVTFTRSKIVAAKAWAKVRCVKWELYELSDDEMRTLYYGEDQYSLFLRFPFELDRWCVFSDSFLTKFRRLLGLAKSERDVPFPAIVELTSQ